MTNNHMSKLEARKEIARVTDALGVQPPRATTVDDAITVIRRAAKVLHEVGIMECNGVMQRDGFMGWAEANQEAADKRRERCERRITNAFITLYGSDALKAVRFEFQGDPRGPSVSVYMADDKSGQRRLATFW